MTIKLTTTAESNKWVKALIYALSGVGKTRLAATAPNPLIVSTEDRLMSLKGTNPPIPVIKVETAVEFEEAYEFIRNTPDCAGFKTIIIDSISDIAEKILVDYKGNTKDPRKAYGEMNDFMMMMIKKFRDLPEKHVYFIAKAGVDKDETTGMTSWYPLMPGKQLVAQLPYLFDLSMYMQTTSSPDGGKMRVLHTESGIQWQAKDHSGLLPPIIPVILGQPTLSMIFDMALGTPIKPEQKEKKEIKIASTDSETKNDKSNKEEK